MPRYRLSPFFFKADKKYIAGGFYKIFYKKVDELGDLDDLGQKAAFNTTGNCAVIAGLGNG
jgi:hypothetical protein